MITSLRTFTHSMAASRIDEVGRYDTDEDEKSVTTIVDDPGENDTSDEGEPTTPPVDDFIEDG